MPPLIINSVVLPGCPQRRAPASQSKTTPYTKNEFYVKNAILHKGYFVLKLYWVFQKCEHQLKTFIFLHKQRFHNNLFSEAEIRHLL